MKPFKISTSGIRGVIGGALTPDLLTRFAQSFGTYLDSGKVVVGRDTRVTGEMFYYATLAGLISSGCDVIDLGLCPTPSIQLMVEKLKADGGITITAGHNDGSWNALKFLREDGIYLNDFQGQELLDIYHQGEFTRMPWDKLGEVIYNSQAVETHVHEVLEHLNVDLIRERGFKVAIDPCNGVGSLVDFELLEELGCEVVSINDELTGIFPHDPEPTPANMRQLASLVRASRADIGFAQDVDADRLAIVSENGKPISEEYTLALLCEFILGKAPGADVVTNLSSTQAINDIAKRHNSNVVRTKVGEEYVIELTKNLGAAIGGEGSGGVIIPPVHYAEDSLAAMGVILEFMAQEKANISSLIGSLPQYKMVKEKVNCPPEKIYSILNEVRDIYSGEEKGEVDLSDGIKVSHQDSWVHIRVSTTEPIIRVISEARTEKEALDLNRGALRQIMFKLSE